MLENNATVSLYGTPTPNVPSNTPETPRPSSPLRLHGVLSTAVKGLLDFLRVPEDQPLESERVSKVVKDTQTKVEAYYYELRKGVFDFDEVGSSREGSETENCREN